MSTNPQHMIDALDRVKFIEDTRGAAIDPDNREDWASFALGFFIGKGFLIHHARVMADLYSVGDWSRAKLDEWLAIAEEAREARIENDPSNSWPSGADGAG